MADGVPRFGDKFCPHCGVEHMVVTRGGGPHSAHSWPSYQPHSVAECTRNLLKQLVKVRGLGSPHIRTGSSGRRGDV